MIGDSSLFVLIALCVLAAAFALPNENGNSLQSQFEEILDQISSGHARSLLQMADDNQVVISVPADTEVTLSLLFKNGTEEERQYAGPSAYFFPLDEIEQIRIIPTDDDNTQVEIEEYNSSSRTGSSSSNTLILSSAIDQNNSQSSQQFQPITQQSFQTFSADSPTIQLLPGLIVGESSKYQAPEDNVPQGSYIVGQGSQTNEIQDAFSTIVSVDVDDRSVPSDPDFGIPFQPLTTSPQSLVPYLTPSAPTLQRGVPNPYTSASPSPSPSPSPPLNLPPPTQDDLQQSIYDQFGDLQLSLSVSVAPLDENVDQNGGYQNQMEIFDPMIMSVAGDVQNGGSLVGDEITVEDAGGDLVGVQANGMIERDPSRCVQMEELIRDNGGDLFTQAMKVANLDYDTIGDIIVVFLPDSIAFERQLLSSGLDLLSPSLSPSQLNQLRQLLLYHIVPDVLLLNLASIATPRSNPLVTANEQSFNLGIQDDEVTIIQNNNNIDNNSNNGISNSVVRIGSNVPSIACQGFLFTLDNVLVPGNQI